ncbi:hypothetical protein CTI14_23800 [Methylobacterium radiotolerans]|nr:hypothetical protein CTI14_23800 [Methylobacterium radiotolerans]
MQELAADLAALGVRVTDLEENMVSKEDFARLEERVNALGAVEGDPTALQGITDQLAALNTSVDELTANYDTLRADVDDNASNIAALNDLTVLLNQDILDLRRTASRRPKPPRATSCSAPTSTTSPTAWPASTPASPTSRRPPSSASAAASAAPSAA